MPPTIPAGVVLRARYRIVRLIHQSRHANVYMVEDQHLKGHVWAVREMQLVAVDPFERARMAQQFQQEAQQLSLLSHPNLAKVVDFFSEGTNLYIVREYVHGSDLGQFLQGRTMPMPEKEALQATLQVLDALIHIHGRKMPAIFYRELAARNIIMLKAGEVKLLDLGLARLFHPLGDSDAVARAGSLDYAAPEQFSENGNFDQRSLVYSVGALLYHMLTRRNPSLSPFALEPVEDINPTISVATEEIVHRATEEDPRDRYGSLSDLRKAVVTAMKAPSASPGTGRGRKGGRGGWEPGAVPQDEDGYDGSIWNWVLAFFMLSLMTGALVAIYYYFFRA